VHLENAVVQLVRIGLQGDAAAVAQFAKRFLRDDATQEQCSPKTRDALAKLVASAPSTVQRFVEPVAEPTTGQFVAVEAPGDSYDVPLLDHAATVEVEQLIQEHERAAALEAVGLHPTRTVLLTGAPGTGKTSTARSIAQRLGVPLFRADLSALMSSYLGKTGQNLKAALTQARAVPSVMLLDEFDAIAKRRDDPTDVGELKRIVNVLLLELEEWPAGGLLIAATNHPELLDRAIWRRFERVVEIGLPSADVRRQIVERHLSRHGRAVSALCLDTLAASTYGCSGSDLATQVRSAVRKAVLAGSSDIERTLLDDTAARLRGLAGDDEEARRAFCEVSAQLGLTQREIASLLGVSHVTVGKILRSGAKRRPAVKRGESEAGHV
jgi:SpoVK/Ycf46/Vps4 family AAA+-type ATPase